MNPYSYLLSCLFLLLPWARYCLFLIELNVEAEVQLMFNEFHWWTRISEWIEKFELACSELREDEQLILLQWLAFMKLWAIPREIRVIQTRASFSFRSIGCFSMDFWKVLQQIQLRPFVQVERLESPSVCEQTHTYWSVTESHAEISLYLSLFCSRKISFITHAMIFINFECTSLALRAHFDYLFASFKKSNHRLFPVAFSPFSII